MSGPDLQYESFQSHLNDKFVFALNDQRWELELVEVSAFKFNPDTKVIRAFSLFFRGPKDLVLEQNTYTIEHESLGRFDLFACPRMPDDEGTYFEIIFN